MIALLLERFKEYKYGLICETPFPNEGQIDYYAKFVERTHGYFCDFRYHYPSNEERVPARLTIYPHAHVKFIEKEAIQRIVKESNIFIHNDVANVNRVAESNARYIKDFEIVEENV